MKELGESRVPLTEDMIGLKPIKMLTEAKSESEIFYDQIAEVYDSLCKNSEHYYRVCILNKTEEHRKRLGLKKEDYSVLCVGCGTGADVVALGKEGGYKVTGMDISQTMLDKANENVIKNKVSAKLFKDDILKSNSNLNESFNAVVCAGNLLSYMDTSDDVVRALKNINGYLKKGGLLLGDIYDYGFKF